MARQKKETEATEAELVTQPVSETEAEAVKMEQSAELVQKKEDAPDALYTREQLVDAYASLGAPKEAVFVALRQAKKDALTLGDAKKIVDAFMKKEVRTNGSAV